MAPCAIEVAFPFRTASCSSHVCVVASATVIKARGASLFKANEVTDEEDEEVNSRQTQ